MNKNDPISQLLERSVQEVIVKKELERKLRSGTKIRLFLGIDPTGFRLHLGHAIALRKLRDFQRLGHEVIFLIGNFTARIGDTSDKDSVRQPLTQQQIDENFRTYKAQASKILDYRSHYHYGYPSPCRRMGVLFFRYTSGVYLKSFWFLPNRALRRQFFFALL